MGNLLDLHGENEFKSRSYATASFRLDKYPKPIISMPAEDRQQIEGVGKGIYAKLDELIATGTIAELDSLLAKTPKGVLEMMKIKGIGPKKVRTIWLELEIESVGELLYACNENRLVGLNGFGAKTQDAVIKSIEFMQSNSGKLHFDVAEMEARTIIKEMNAVSITAEPLAELARRCEIVNEIELLVAGGFSPILSKSVEDCMAVAGYDLHSSTENQLQFKGASKIVEVKIRFADAENYEAMKFQYTPTPEFLEVVGFDKSTFSSEADFFTQKQLPFIIPEMRENKDTLAWATTIKDVENIIQFNHLKGCIHNHSVWSDGSNTVEEMANACMDLGLEYFVISDHSKTAVYANGLQVDRILKQQEEINKLNQKFAASGNPFRVFKSIESDILGDGSLDYEEEILKTFDLVIASVHSNLKMDEEKANMRVIRAIENPYTRILGHPTGRLLLSRPGYPVNHKLMIDACAANNVVIELNAHPYRLDLDWRWINYAQEKGVMISIDPDAHEIAGINDMYYGVCVARKAGLLAANVLNTKTLAEFEKWLRR